MRKFLLGRGGELAAVTFFTVLLLATVAVQVAYPSISNVRSAALWNAALSIGTSGCSAFLFYYLVSERLVRRNRSMLIESARESFIDAKQNIAFAIIHASREGGRHDLVATLSTVDKMLTTHGFRKLFEGGQQADEGYYAFQNQMSEPTSEFDEIVFNLKTIGRAATRLVDGAVVSDPTNYGILVGIGSIVDRIERNGPGYDESKLLCGFIWEIFTGWSNIEGYRGRDVIGGAFEGN